MKKLMGIYVAISGLGLLLREITTNRGGQSVRESRTNASTQLNRDELLRNMNADSFQLNHPQLVATSFGRLSKKS